MASIPAGVLAAGTILPLRDYLEAIRLNEPAGRKLVVGKVKTLIFFSGVVYLIFEILSDSGLIGIGLTGSG